MCVAPKSRFALGTWVIWSQECSWSMCWKRGERQIRPTPVHQVVLAVLFSSISHSASHFSSPSVCLFPSLSVLPLSGGLCAAHKDVQHVSPSCASGAMNCLITAATPLPEHPSSVKQNFQSVWSARLHFHICIFLLFSSSLSPFSSFWATGAVAHIMRLSLAEAGREMEPQRLAFRGLVPRERQIAHLIIHDTDGNTIGRGREMRGEIKRGERRKEGGGENARLRRLEFQIYQKIFPQPLFMFFPFLFSFRRSVFPPHFPFFFLTLLLYLSIPRWLPVDGHIILQHIHYWRSASLLLIWKSNAPYICSSNYCLSFPPIWW